MENSNNIEQRINDRLQSDVSFNFDKFFADAWSIFKKVTFLVAGSIFVLAVPILIVYSITLPFMLGIQSFTQYFSIIQEDPYYFQEIQQSPIYLLKQMLVNVIIALLFAPINAGLIKLCRDADKTGEVNFGTIFKYYKGEYFGRLILAVLITAMVSGFLNIAFSFIPFVGGLIYMVVVLVFAILISFVQPLIIFGNLDLGKAFSLSFKIAGKFFWPVLGYSLLFGLLTGLGLIACCIGIFFTAAFIPVCNYLLYKYAVGFPEDEETEEVQTHWQEQPPVA